MFVWIPGNSKLLQMCWISSGYEGMVDGTSKHSNDTNTLLFHLFKLHRAWLVLNTVSIHIITTAVSCLDTRKELMTATIVKESLQRILQDHWRRQHPNSMWKRDLEKEPWTAGVRYSWRKMKVAAQERATVKIKIRPSLTTATRLTVAEL